MSMKQLDLFEVYQRDNLLKQEIERISNEIDRKDDQGVDTYDLHQELQSLQAQLAGN